MKLQLIVVFVLLQNYVCAQSWEYLGTPPASSHITNVNDTLFAATSLNLFFSTDNSNTWIPILRPDNAPFMQSDFIRPAAAVDNGKALEHIESLVLEDFLFFIVTLYSSGTTSSTQQLYRSSDRGQSLELVYSTVIGSQGGFQLQLPERLEENVFLLRSEGFANFAGPVTNHLISLDNGKTWEDNTFAEFQEGAQKTPPFLMDVVDDKLLGVEAVRTIPFQELDKLTFFELPNLEVASQKDIPIGLDSFRLRSAFHHKDTTYLFYFRVDDDGTVLLAKTPDFGDQWLISRLYLNTLEQTVIRTATFEVVEDVIYMTSPDNIYYKLVENAALKLEVTPPPNPPEIAAYNQAYSLNIIKEEELWITSPDGLFQQIDQATWQLPDEFTPYPSTKSITEFQGAYYLLDEEQNIHVSADGQILSSVFQAEGIVGITSFEDAIFAFGEQLYFSQDGATWGDIQLNNVEGNVTDVIALEDELVISTDANQFYFIRNINSSWEIIDVGRGERAIALDVSSNKLYVYELPTSGLDTDITIYEKTSFGDDEWIGQGASLFGELYPTTRFKLLFHQGQIIKLDIADEKLFISENGGFSWREIAPEIGQIMDIELSESYCYLATRNQGIFRTALNDLLDIEETDDEEPEEGNIDLALFMTVDKPNFTPFQNITYTITLLNSGVDTAKDVSVRFFGDSEVDGLAFVEAFTSKGNTRGWDNIWRDIELPPRERATLKVTYFARLVKPLTLFAEVLETRQRDEDSQPNNFSMSRDNEDDEAQVTAYPENQVELVQGEFFRSSEQQDAMLVYPTVVREQVHIRIPQKQAKAVQIRILNSAGNLILQTTLPESQRTIDLDIHRFPKGTYFVQLLGKQRFLGQQVFFKL